MPYPPEFINIQRTFAQHMAAITGETMRASALRTTALYRILGLDWSLNPDDPVWQRFADELREDGTGFDAAYQVYADRYATGVIPDYDTSRPHWGCFSYEYHPDERVVRLHFSNRDMSGVGPLSSQRQALRMDELRTMFAHIQREQPAAQVVRGGSWLYNRGEYQRLFPTEYARSARIDHPALIARGLWGQFLRHGNRMNDEGAALFLARVADLRDATAYAGCFPYQNLLTEAPISAFYTFYGIGAPQATRRCSAM